MGWYPVSLIGWIFTGVHTGLAAVVVHGFWNIDPTAPEIEFYYGTTYMYALLVVILLAAKFYKRKIFYART